jgi:hypothetical protein
MFGLEDEDEGGEDDRQDSKVAMKYSTGAAETKLLIAPHLQTRKNT